MRRLAPVALVLAALASRALAAAPPEPAAGPPPEPAPGEGAPDHKTVVHDARAPGRPASSEVRRPEIERSGAHSAADVLERVPAVSVQGGARGERIFTLRGFEQRQTAVELDGAPIAIAYDGQVDLGMVPASVLDRVRVVAGPASLSQGLGSLGGAVRLETRWPGAGPLVAAELAHDQHAGLTLGASHDATAGPVSWRLFGGLARRDAFHLASGFAPTPRQAAGARVNSDREHASLGADVAWTPTPTQRLRASVLGVDAERGVPPSTLDAVPRYWRFTVWRGLAASLTHEGVFGDGLELRELLSVQRFDNRLDAYDDLTYTTQDSARAWVSWYHDLTVSGRVAATYRSRTPALGDSALRAWLAARHDVHEHPTEGEPTERASRTLLSPAVELDAEPLRGLRVAAGAQVEVELPGAGLASGLGPSLAVGPHLLVRYAAAPALSVGASVARRTRAPTLKDRLSGALGARLPNPDLRPESAWHVGLDASWRPRDALRLDAALFDAEVDDVIEAVRVDAGLDQLRNTGDARTLGAELAVRYAPSPLLELSAGGLALDTRLAYRPRYRLTAEVVLTPWPWLELAAAGRLVGPQRYQDPNTRAWRELGAYGVVDIRLEGRIADTVSLWVRLANASDTAYESEVGYPEPGRELWLGLRVVAPQGEER